MVAAPGRAARSMGGAPFAQRGHIMRRAQRWMLYNPQRVLDVVVSETGKTYEDAQLADLGDTVSALAFWAKAPSEVSRRRTGAVVEQPARGRQEARRPLEPVGVVGVIGPWNYPIVNSFGDCIPALMAGNSVIIKPSEVTPLSALLMAEMMRECGAPRGRLPGRHRRRVDRRGGDRHGRLRDVHRLDARPGRRC